MGDRREGEESYDEKVEAFKFKIKEHQSLFGQSNKSLSEIEADTITGNEMKAFLAYRNLLKKMEQILLLKNLEEIKKSLTELKTEVEEARENMKDLEKKFLGWINNRFTIFSNIDYITDPRMSVEANDIQAILQEVQSDIKNYSE